MNWFYKFAVIIVKPLFHLIFNLKIYGRENIPKTGGFTVVCNHRGYSDPVFLALSMKPQVIFMGKEELFKIPVAGTLFKWLGGFPVARGKGDMTAINYAIQTVKDGKALSVFPEGTRSKDGQLLKFKSGAALITAKSGGDVLPACVYYKGGLSFRKKVIIKFGKIIPNSDFKMDEIINSTQLKEASLKMRTEISSLLEDAKCL